ncbi:Amidohydrolase [Thermoanaerobacter thermohydrosulfuricus]|nr:Amidohydrolase [Thermoanaerobacter thermohydrosulfuricus]
MVYDLILKNSNIIDKKGEIKKNLNIYINQGEIVRISGESKEVASAKEIIDCGNLFITPGLVNLHTHSPMNIMPKKFVMQFWKQG